MRHWLSCACKANERKAAWYAFLMAAFASFVVTIVGMAS